VSEPQLRRSLGLGSAIAIVVGGVIGSGIFMKPHEIARALPSEAWIYAVWGILGVLCLFGAFAFAELGAMFPEAGGQYAFLREAWGRFPAFLYGWCLFLVLNTGTLAGLAVVFATALDTMIPMPATAEIVVAIGMLLVLAWINHRGVGAGAAFQNISTLAKVAALGAIVAGAAFASARAIPIAPAPETAAAAGDLVRGVVTAAVAIFWAFEGWYVLPFSAAEMRNPARDLPRGLILAMVFLVLLYLAANFAYMHAVPLAEMRGLDNAVAVPRLAVERIFGAWAGSALVVLLCISVVGSANPGLLSTPRAFYAMGRDALLFRGIDRVHPKYRTPFVAIWVQALWSVVLVIVLRTFRDITEFVIFAALIFYALTVAAVYVLRRRQPQRARPYRCWGYPWAPALFIAVVLFVDGHTLADPASRTNALLGLGILAAGAMVYWARRRRINAPA
jgi:APA family basic amino acid/polyamine antiporter